jgi:hypothetical protein
MYFIFEIHKFKCFNKEELKRIKKERESFHKKKKKRLFHVHAKYRDEAKNTQRLLTQLFFSIT